jgi:hypothetical protein
VAVDLGPVVEWFVLWVEHDSDQDEAEAEVEESGGDVQLQRDDNFLAGDDLRVGQARRDPKDAEAMECHHALMEVD